MSVKAFCPFFYWLACFFVIELHELFVYFGNLSPCWSLHLQIFSLVRRLSFHFVYGFLCCAKAYKFD